MQTAREACQIALQELKNHDTDYVSRHRQHTQYEVGYIVVVGMFPVNRDQLNQKCPFADRWAGQYKIIAKISDDSYRLKLADWLCPNFERVFHAVQLKPYIQRPGEPILQPT